MHRFGRWKFSLGFCPGKLMSYLFCDFIVDTITGVLLPTPPPPHPPSPPALTTLSRLCPWAVCVCASATPFTFLTFLSFREEN